MDVEIDILCRISYRGADILVRTIFETELAKIQHIGANAIKRVLQRLLFKSVSGMLSQTKYALTKTDGIIAVSTMAGNVFVASVGCAYMTTVYYHSLGTLVSPTVNATGEKTYLVQGKVWTRHIGSYCVFTTCDKCVLDDTTIAQCTNSSASLFICVA